MKFIELHEAGSSGVIIIPTDEIQEIYCNGENEITLVYTKSRELPIHVIDDREVIVRALNIV